MDVPPARGLSLRPDSARQGDVGPPLTDPLLDGDRYRYVRRITTTSIRRAARDAVLPFVERLAGKPETEAVVALSGLADLPGRRFLDVYSDIDIALFISLPEAAGYPTSREFVRARADALPRWLPAFSFSIPVLDRLMEVNCRQLILEVEENPRTSWSPAKQEAYGYSGEVMYDRAGRVAALVADKCRPPSGERLAWLASRLPWDGWVNPAAQVHRGLLLNAKFLLNRSVDVLVELLLVAEGRHPPADKWRAEAALECPGAPPGLSEQVREVLECRCEAGDLLRAAGLMQQLSAPVLDRLAAAGQIPADPYRYVSVHVDEDKQLLPRVGGDDLLQRRGRDLTGDDEALFGLANVQLLEHTDNPVRVRHLASPEQGGRT